MDSLPSHLTVRFLYVTLTAAALCVLMLQSPALQAAAPADVPIRQVELLRTVQTPGAFLGGPHFDAVSREGEVLALTRDAYVRFEAGPHCLVRDPVLWLPEPIGAIAHQEVLRAGPCPPTPTSGQRPG